MRQFTRPQPPVKPARRTARPAAPFGSGILASHPYAGRMPYDGADLAWAAEAFASDDGPTDAELDAMARDAEWDDRFNGWMDSACAVCGAEIEGPGEFGLCDRCETRAIDASIASANAAYGIGYEVF